MLTTIDKVWQRRLDILCERKNFLLNMNLGTYPCSQLFQKCVINSWDCSSSSWIAWSHMLKQKLTAYLGLLKPSGNSGGALSKSLHLESAVMFSLLFFLSSDEQSTSSMFSLSLIVLYSIVFFGNWLNILMILLCTLMLFGVFNGFSN